MVLCISKIAVVLQAYYRVYKEHIPVAQLCRETAAVMQEFTREWSLPDYQPIGHTVGVFSFTPGNVGFTEPVAYLWRK